MGAPGAVGRGAARPPAGPARPAAPAAGHARLRGARRRSCSAFSLRIEPGSDWFYPATLGARRGLDGRRLRLRTAAPRPDLVAERTAAAAGRHAGRARPGPGRASSSSARFVVRTMRPRRSTARCVTVARPRRPGLGAAAGRDHRGQRGGRGAVLPRRRSTPPSPRHPVRRARPLAYAVVTARHRQRDARLRRRAPRCRSSGSSAGPRGGILAPIITHVHLVAGSMLLALPASVRLSRVELRQAAPPRAPADGLAVGERLAGHDVADGVVGRPAPRCPSSRSGCGRWSRRRR